MSIIVFLSLSSHFQFFLYMYFIILIIITIINIIIITINIIIIIIIIIIVVVVYFYVSCTCTDLVEKCVRFPQGLSLVLYLYFRIFYFCIVELWVLVNLKYRKNNNNKKRFDPKIFLQDLQNIDWPECHLKYQQGVRSTTYYDFFKKSIYFLHSAMFRAKTSAHLQAVR